MVQLKKRGLSLLLTLVLMLSLCVPAMAVSKSELTSAISESAAYMLNAVKEPQVGSIGGEWAVIGLARSGYDVPQEYWDDYYAHRGGLRRVLQGRAAQEKVHGILPCDRGTHRYRCRSHQRCGI